MPKLNTNLEEINFLLEQEHESDYSFLEWQDIARTKIDTLYSIIYRLVDILEINNIDAKLSHE